MDSALCSVRIFPGSIAEYEAAVHYTVRPIMLPRPNQAVYAMSSQDGTIILEDVETRKRLLEEGIDALVNETSYVLTGDGSWRFSGLPVAQKR